MLAILAGGVFLIGSKQLTFSSTYRLRAEFQNVAGLASGADVRVGGIHAGTVRSISLPSRPDAKVTVEMDLSRDTRNVIKENSIASIQAEGLLGDKYVEISFGSDKGRSIKDGDTAGSEPPLEMSALFKKADGILDQTQDAMRSVDKSAKDFQSISGKINQGKGTVGAMVNDKALYHNMTKATATLQEDSEALKHNFLLRGYFKKRGYEDTSELAKHEIAQLPPGPCQKTFTFEAKQLFHNSDTAKLDDNKPLKQVGQFLQTNQFGLAVVVAHGSMKGDADKEQQLTQARAAVVRDYLVQNFRLDDSRVMTKGLGKVDDPNDNAAVEILVYPTAPGHNRPAAGPIGSALETPGTRRP